jgi:hypothetical protein
VRGGAADACAAQEDWPRAALALDASAIHLSPAAPRPGEPVSIRTELRKTGNANLYGMTIDLRAFDTRERDPRVHHHFVRSVPAGGSVVLETSATFPLGFGGVVVTVLPLSQETEFSPLMAGGADRAMIAGRLVDLAPRGYADLVRATVGCKPGCSNLR